MSDPLLDDYKRRQDTIYAEYHDTLRERRDREEDEAVSTNTGLVVYGVVAMIAMALAGTLEGAAGVITFGIFFVLCALTLKGQLRRARSN